MNARAGWRGAAGLIGVVAFGGVAAAQSFTVLAPLPDSPGCEAWGISPDGRVVAGSCVDAETGVPLATIWNDTALPIALAPYGESNVAYGAPGSVAIYAGAAFGVAIVWGGGAGGSDANLGGGEALDISADGMVVVGYLYSGGGHITAFARHGTDAPLSLPPADGDTDSSAQRVNSAGTLAAGGTLHFDRAGLFYSRACVWSTAGGAPALLDQLPGHRIAHGNGIDADGSVVVGFSACCEENPATAARWVNGVPEEITPGEFGNAHACSDDGSVVVGEGFVGAFVWDPVNGLRGVRQVLEGAGVQIPSTIVLVAARDVSGDGMKIIGWGFDLDSGATIGWVADLAECRADFDGDGFVTGLDFDAFVAAFEAGDPSSDFDGDGFVTGLDFDAFVVAFEEGC